MTSWDMDRAADGYDRHLKADPVVGDIKVDLSKVIFRTSGEKSQ